MSQILCNRTIDFQNRDHNTNTLRVTSNSQIMRMLPTLDCTHLLVNGVQATTIDDLQGLESKLTDEINAIAPFAFKNPCRAASTVNIVDLANAGATIDDVTLAATNRVLLKNQSTASQNGIYTVSSIAPVVLARAWDFDSPQEVVSGCLIPVTEGTINKDTVYTMTSDTSPIIVGTSSLVFALFCLAGMSQLQAGADSKLTISETTYASSKLTKSGGILETRSDGTIDSNTNLTLQSSNGSGFVQLRVNSSTAFVSTYTLQSTGRHQFRGNDGGISLEISPGNPYTAPNFLQLRTSGGLQGIMFTEDQETTGRHCGVMTAGGSPADLVIWTSDTNDTPISNPGGTLYSIAKYTKDQVYLYSPETVSKFVSLVGAGSEDRSFRIMENDGTTVGLEMKYNSASGAYLRSRLTALNILAENGNAVIIGGSTVDLQFGNSKLTLTDTIGDGGAMNLTQDGVVTLTVNQTDMIFNPVSAGSAGFILRKNGGQLGAIGIAEAANNLFEMSIDAGGSCALKANSLPLYLQTTGSYNVTLLPASGKSVATGALAVTTKLRVGDTATATDMLELYSGASHCNLVMDHVNTSQNNSIIFNSGGVLKSNIICDGAQGDLSLYGYPSGRFINISQQSATGSVKIVGHTPNFNTIAQFNNADNSAVFPYKVRVGSASVPVNNLDVSSSTAVTVRVEGSGAYAKKILLANGATDVGQIGLSTTDEMSVGTITNKKVAFIQTNTNVLTLENASMNTSLTVSAPQVVTNLIRPGYYISNGTFGLSASSIGSSGNPFDEAHIVTVKNAIFDQAASTSPDFTVTGTSGWTDLPCYITTRGNGTAVPPYSPISGPFYGYEFVGTGSQQHEIFCEFHIPHNYDAINNAGMFFHVHATTNAAAPAGNFHFAVDYAVAKSGSVFTYATYGTAHIVGTINTQYKHVIAETTGAFLAGALEVDALVVCRFYRDPAHVDDTSLDPVFLLFADAHIRVNKFTTKNKVAPFYT